MKSCYSSWEHIRVYSENRKHIQNSRITNISEVETHSSYMRVSKLHFLAYATYTCAFTTNKPLSTETQTRFHPLSRISEETQLRFCFFLHTDQFCGASLYTENSQPAAALKSRNYWLSPSLCAARS